MQKNRVVEEYFDLLFNEEVAPGIAVAKGEKKSKLPAGYFKSRSEMKKPLLVDESQESSYTSDLSAAEESDDMSIDTAGFNVKIRSAEENKTLREAELALSLTEFLRVNMRLAEDRVLSFVTVFCTGYGTVR